MQKTVKTKSKGFNKPAAERCAVSVYVCRELAEQVRAAAREDKCSVSLAVRRALEDYVKKD